MVLVLKVVCIFAILALNLVSYSCSTVDTSTGGIRQNLFEVYYFEKIICTACAHAPLAKDGGASQP